MIYKAFIGFDDAQPVSYNVAQFSLVRHASQPVSITPMVLETLPIKRRGLTKFTYTRFLIPYLMGFKGWGLWFDSDIIFNDDPIRIWDFADTSKAVIVAEEVMPFERAAIMLFNCAHPDNRVLTPEYIEGAEKLHQIGWTRHLGFFPRSWNHCVGYCPPTEDVSGVHFTQGLPIFPETEGSEHTDKWRLEHKLMNSAKPWAELMGNSVHAVEGPDGRRVARLKAPSNGVG